MAGVGMRGGRAVESRKSFGVGIPWWVVILGIVLLGVAAAYVPQMIAGKG